MMEFYFFLMRHFPDKVKAETKRNIRCELQRERDPLQNEICGHSWNDLFDRDAADPWRRVYSDWESWYEYTIVNDWNGLNNAEIDKMVDRLYVECPPSQYDCTGKPFTSFVYWNRTKSGIVIIRRWSLDV